MRNPFYSTFLGCFIISICLGLPYFIPCSKQFLSSHSRLDGLLLGVLSSVFLLLFIEIINWYRDKRLYGFIKGKYKRISIYQTNENDARGNNDTIYSELEYYKSIDWDIHLKYHYNGIYTGTAEYYNHSSSDNKKTLVSITLNLNTANRMIGEGSYKYISKNDFGIYSFHVDNDNHNRIILTYKNTIPSGLARGYEIWEKVK
ncbi:MAG: hypothetical protein JST82_13485 [Bacteroidetes bacterium]|nr:hypothetical protein [Bacteroidota bacterium]